MIKKLVFILFILLFISFTTVKLKADSIIQLPTQYVQIGIGDDALLKEKNLSIHSGFVNWEVEGNYTVTYNDKLNNVYKKTFTILPDKQNQTILKKSEENLIMNSNVNDVIDVFYISETSYYIISNYQTLDSILPDQEKICITYYEDDSYKWEYRYNKFSRFKSALLNDDNLIVTGLVYNEDNNYINTIILFEITKERQIIKSREIKANKSCFIYGMHLFENNLFLITSTSGNGGDYGKIKEDYIHRMVILKLGYENFQIIDGTSEQQLQEFSVIDASFYNTRITVNVLLKQNENINGAIMTNCIYEYNDNLEFINKYYYSTQTKDYLGHQVTKNDICFYAIDNRVNSNCVKVEYINKGVYIKNILLDLENENSINNMEVINVNNDDIYFCLKNGINKDCEFLGFARINSEDGVNYYTTTSESIDILSSKISNGYIINTFIRNDNLLFKTYNLIEIQTIINESTDLLECKKRVIVNGEDTKRVQYENTVNKNIFGAYQNLNYTKDQFNNSYLLSDEVFVFLSINIKSDTIYQQGLKLQFNGIGFLNGNEIKTNFVINDVGKYLLEIRGKNIENVLISFEILDLTISSSIKEEVNLKLSGITFKEEILEDISYVNTICDFKSNKKYSNVVPLTISIISFGILSLIILRKKI